MRIFDLDTRQFRHFDLAILLVAIVLALGGVAVLRGSSESPEIQKLAARQTVWMFVGLAAFLVSCSLDPKSLEWASYPFYALSIGLLAGLFFYDVDPTRGARAWYPIGPFRLQPSELAKIATAMALARHLARHRVELRKPQGLLAPAIVVVIPMALTVKQNDTGTALVFVPLFLSMIYVGGVGKRVLAGMAVAVLLCVALALPRLHPYQKARLAEVLGKSLSGRLMAALGENPEDIWERATKKSGYNIDQSLISLGSGGMLGKGWGRGTQTFLGYLPEFQTDFIFASLGEQFGFLGCALLLLGYATLVWRGGRIALEGRDMYGSLLAVGLMSIFITHIVVNLGMVMRLLPIIGVPLPLISYGGSFMLSVFVMLGLIVNVGMRKYLY